MFMKQILVFLVTISWFSSTVFMHDVVSNDDYICGGFKDEQSALNQFDVLSPFEANDNSMDSLPLRVDEMQNKIDINNNLILLNADNRVAQFGKTSNDKVVSCVDKVNNSNYITYTPDMFKKPNGKYLTPTNILAWLTTHKRMSRIEAAYLVKSWQPIMRFSCDSYNSGIRYIFKNKSSGKKYSFNS